MTIHGLRVPPHAKLNADGTRGPEWCNGHKYTPFAADFDQQNTRTGEGRWEVKCAVCGAWNYAEDPT